MNSPILEKPMNEIGVCKNCKKIARLVDGLCPACTAHAERATGSAKNEKETRNGTI